MIPGVTTATRITRLGKIRLGEKREGKGGKEYPAALDHFNFEDAPDVQSVYGAGCKVLYPVMVPSNPRVIPGAGWDFSVYWKTSRSAYGKGSGLFCRCSDGATATRANKGLDEAGKPLDPEGWAFLQRAGQSVDPGELFDLPCGAEDDTCGYWKKGYCKNLGVLDIMLPRASGVGIWTIATSSINSIRNIESGLQLIASATGGVLAGIPLTLALVPLEVSPEGRKKTVYVLELKTSATLGQLATLRRRSLDSGGAWVAMIEGAEPMPDDLYPHGGGALDRALAPALPAHEPGEKPSAVRELEKRAAARSAAPDPGPTVPPPASPASPRPTPDQEEPPPPDDDDLPFGRLTPEEAAQIKLKGNLKQKPASSPMEW